MVKNYKHRNAFLTDFQTQVCYGTLLGDSSLSRPQNGQNYHLACYHSEAQIDWLNLKWRWLQPHSRPIQYCAYTDKRNGKTYKGSRFHTISAPCFTNLAQVIYPGGQKVIPPNFDSIINHPVALACLICDDGSWDGAGISIATKHFTILENELLAHGLGNIFDIEISVNTVGKYPFLRIPATSVEQVRELCSDYLLESMLYKFGGPNYSSYLVGKIERECPICHQTFLSYKSANQQYCSQRCAGIGKPAGYMTRTKIDTCPLCGEEFLRYNRKQQTCVPCRDKPFPHEACRICGKAVKTRGRVYCSMRCSVIGCHIAQGHKVNLNSRASQGP